MQRSCLILLVAVMFAGCGSNDENIVKIADFSHLLVDSSEAMAASLVNLEFWKSRYNKNGDGSALMKMASIHSQLFKADGDPKHLCLSDSLLRIVLQQSDLDSHGVYHSLALNGMDRHEFRDAQSYLQKSLQSTENMSGKLFTLFDVYLELGDIERAVFLLAQLRNKSTFPYLVRMARLKDLEGNLDSAIFFMEKAMLRVRNNDNLLVWSKTNLGEMYGHAGRIKDSYQCFLDVLIKKPGDEHALKGIAWILFAHDKNTKQAEWVIENILLHKKMPDLYLMLAEIAAFKNDDASKTKHLAQFVNEATLSYTGNMYRPYLAKVLAEELQRPKLAIRYALEEIESRPSVNSFDLLSWVYFKNGDIGKALEIVRTKLHRKTQEPEIMYHMGMIYSAAGDKEKGVEFLKLALESEFEIGPVISRDIRRHLDSQAVAGF